MYTINYHGREKVVGKPYCFECSMKLFYDTVDHIQIGKAEYWHNNADIDGTVESRIHMVNSGSDTFICTNCGKTFGPYKHVTVVSEEFS